MRLGAGRRRLLPLVDGRNHTDRRAIIRILDRHAQYSARAVPSLLVARCVESHIRIRIVNVERAPGLGHVAGQTLADGHRQKVSVFGNDGKQLTARVVDEEDCGNDGQMRVTE